MLARVQEMRITVVLGLTFTYTCSLHFDWGGGSVQGGYELLLSEWYRHVYATETQAEEGTTFVFVFVCVVFALCQCVRCVDLCTYECYVSACVCVCVCVRAC
jgi:hypothetical protein